MRAHTPHPPLGWNSYDCYGCSANQRITYSNLKAFAEKLKPYGYEYFVIDNGWFGEYSIEPNEEFTRQKHAADIRIDCYGRLLPSKVSFPSGLEPLISFAHQQDIKFGVHMMRGIPRKAVELKLPVLGTDVTAEDIADTSDICSWCDYMYGVNMDHPAAQNYYNSVVELLASWGIDFIKYDDIIHKPREIESVVQAIHLCNRSMTLSLSPGNVIDTSNIDLYRKANMFRITGDIWDRRGDLDKGFDRLKEIQNFHFDGSWPDLDMIPFGRLMVWNPSVRGREGCFLLAGYGVERDDEFTEVQRRSFITQRALAASPLFMGGELTMSDHTVFSLITNYHMLACNQNGVVAKLSYEEPALEVWVSPDRSTQRAGWMGIFNRSASSLSGSIDLSSLELPTCLSLFSIWDNSLLPSKDGEIFYHLDADDVLFLRFEDNKA